MGITEPAHAATQSLSQQMREKRSEMMILELEAVALRLFEERGFTNVTVQDIADRAQISVRTFYRYFPAKEDVLQLRIDRRSEALRAALARTSLDDAPLHALRIAICETGAVEDAELVRRWISVIAAEPSVVRAVIGGLHLKVDSVIAEFFGARFGLPSEALVPRMLAAAVGGVLEAAHTQWFFGGGDLVSTISDSLEVLERGIGSDPSTWSSGERPTERPNRTGRNRRTPAQALQLR